MQNNECVYICDQFTDYRENTLSSELIAKVDAHLAACSPCRNIFQELGNVLETLQNLPPQNTRSDFTETLMSRINEVSQESLWHKLSHSSYTRVAGYAVAAGLIVALGLNVWIDPKSPLSPNGSRHFAEDEMIQPKQTKALTDQVDSSHSQQNDSLALRHNAINTAKSLQLVSDTK